MLFAFSGVHAQELQSLPAIQQAVESFIKEKTAGLPGEYTVTATRVDPRLKLGKCSQLQPYLPSGSRLWGNSSVGVRCAGPESWSLYVPVQIRVANRAAAPAEPSAWRLIRFAVSTSVVRGVEHALPYENISIPP